MSGPVLLTGATGFLGAWITAALMAEGRQVVATDVAIDTSRLDALAPQGPAPDWRQLDVADSAALDRLVAETRPHAILHLAALQIPACRADPALGARVNVLGQINVLEAARRHGLPVVYTSSVAAKPRGPANAPANLYGVFKKTGEEIARLYWADHGVPSLGLRPHIVYGLGRDRGETSAITAAILAAARGEPFEIPFATESCFQYAGDVAALFARAAAARWEGAATADLSDRVESTDDVIAAIRAAVPDARVTVAAEHRPSPTTGFDLAPLRAIVGDWTPTPLAQGVAATVAMARTRA